MRLRLKLLLPFTLAFATFILVIHFYWAPGMLHQSYLSIVKRENTVLKTLEPGIVRALLAGDLGSVFAILDYNKQLNHNWGEIELFNQSERRIYPLSTQDSDASPYSLEVEHELVWTNQKVGKLKITCNWQKERSLQNKKIHTMEIFALLLFGITVGSVVLWQTIWIQKPIMRLEKASHQLSKGNFNVKLRPGSNDEIGKLTKTFIGMRNSLLSSHINLESAVTDARKSEEKFRVLIENAADGIFLFSTIRI